MARDAKDNTKGFYRYMYVGWKAKDSVLPLINKMGELVTADGEVEYLNFFFLSFFFFSLCW